MKHTIILSFILVLLFTNNSYAIAPELKLQDQPIENIVTHFANEHGVDPKIALAVMKCESGGRKVMGDGGRAYNEFQFHKGTWDKMSKAMGEELDINSGYDQAKLATWAIANGYGTHWTSYVAIQKGGTYTFYSRLMKKTYTVNCKV
jgi:hypothetical protein